MNKHATQRTGVVAAVLSALTLGVLIGRESVQDTDTAEIAGTEPTATAGAQYDPVRVNVECTSTEMLDLDEAIVEVENLDAAMRSFYVQIGVYEGTTRIGRTDFYVENLPSGATELKEIPGSRFETSDGWRPSGDTLACEVEAAQMVR